MLFVRLTSRGRPSNYMRVYQLVQFILSPRDARHLIEGRKIKFEHSYQLDKNMKLQFAI